MKNKLDCNLHCLNEIQRLYSVSALLGNAIKMPTGKVSMNKILENAHSCVALLQVHCH